MPHERFHRPEGPVEIQIVPEGESGVVFGRLSERVKEAIVAYYAQPEHVRTAQRGKQSEFAFLAARIGGISPAFVRDAKRDPRVQAGVRKRLKEVLTYMMPDVVFGQLELAIQKRDKQAAMFCARMGEFINERPEITNTIINQVNNAPAKDGGIAEDLKNYTWLRELQRTGVFDKVGQITDGSEPPEPPG